MTDKINDGGPAFPRAYKLSTDYGSEDGMSLRDWFAGQALAGVMSNNVALAEATRPAEGVGTFIANTVYEVADAMLKAREAKQ